MLTAFFGAAAAAGWVMVVRYHRLWRESVARELRIWESAAAAVSASNRRDDRPGRGVRPG